MAFFRLINYCDLDMGPSSLAPYLPIPSQQTALLHEWDSVVQSTHFNLLLLLSVDGAHVCPGDNAPKP